MKKDNGRKEEREEWRKEDSEKTKKEGRKQAMNKDKGIRIIWWIYFVFGSLCFFDCAFVSLLDALCFLFLLFAPLFAAFFAFCFVPFLYAPLFVAFFACCFLFSLFVLLCFSLSLYIYTHIPTHLHAYICLLLFAFRCARYLLLTLLVALCFMPFLYAPLFVALFASCLLCSFGDPFFALFWLYSIAHRETGIFLSFLSILAGEPLFSVYFHRDQESKEGRKEGKKGGKKERKEGIKTERRKGKKTGSKKDIKKK